MNTPVKVPAITTLIADGYGECMLSTVIESVRSMVTSMRADGYISDYQEACILNLLMLEGAILKDCYGIDINEKV